MECSGLPAPPVQGRQALKRTEAAEATGRGRGTGGGRGEGSGAQLPLPLRSHMDELVPAGASEPSPSEHGGQVHPMLTDRAGRPVFQAGPTAPGLGTLLRLHPLMNGALSCQPTEPRSVLPATVGPLPLPCPFCQDPHRHWGSAGKSSGGDGPFPSHCLIPHTEKGPHLPLAHSCPIS